MFRSKFGGWWPGRVDKHASDSDHVRVWWSAGTFQYVEDVHKTSVFLELLSDGYSHGIDRPFEEGDKALAVSKNGCWSEVYVRSADHEKQTVTVSRSCQSSRCYRLPEWLICWPPGVGGAGKDVGCWESGDAFVSHSDICCELLSDEDVFKSCIVPVTVKSWRKKAVQVFRRCGFVVLRNVLCEEDCRSLLQACRRAEKEMAARRAEKSEHEKPGSRGPGRWSFGCASKTGSMFHDIAWVKLLNCKPLLAILKFLFPGGGKCVAAGGDFVDAGTPYYQHLHSDVLIEGEFDVKFPPPYVSVNFVVQKIDSKNGPMRLLPGTQCVSAAVQRRAWLWIPGVEQEPAEWKRSTLQPLEEGDVLLRDVRVLHGGTPNVSAATRFLPSLEFAWTSYLESVHYRWPLLGSMPMDNAKILSRQALGWCLPNLFVPNNLKNGWQL